MQRAAKLNESDIDRSCISLARWWRHTHELETAIGYQESMPLSRAAWDSIIADNMAEPYEPLYGELWACARIWNALTRSFCVPIPSTRSKTVLDSLVTLSRSEKFSLPKHAFNHSKSKSAGHTGLGITIVDMPPNVLGFGESQFRHASSGVMAHGNS